MVILVFSLSTFLLASYRANLMLKRINEYVTEHEIININKGLLKLLIELLITPMQLQYVRVGFYYF